MNPSHKPKIFVCSIEDAKKRFTKNIYKLEFNKT